MASRRADLIPVVQKSYDLCAGLYTHVNRFPRAQRSLLGRVILEDALQMLVSLTVANRRTDKTETLREASGRLDQRDRRKTDEISPNDAGIVDTMSRSEWPSPARDDVRSALAADDS